MPMPAGGENPPRVAVFGSGYLGAVHAACLAEMGCSVLGVDTDADRVRALRAGRPGIYEPGLVEVLGRGLASGRLAFTTSYREAAEFGNTHFLCVGTPQRDGSPATDLSQLEACVGALAPLLNRECLVVGKSTVPVGTAQRLAGQIREQAPAGAGAELAWNPEFLREGHAVEDTLRPDRIVVGATSPRATAALRRIYARPLAAGTPLVVTDLASAELVKLAANAFLVTKISFINAMAEVCEAAGADVVELAEALGHDPRIGAGGMRPGLGYGGGCLPKDSRGFLDRADELGAGQAVAFLRDMDEINLRRRTAMVDLARELAGGRLEGAAIGVLGLSFKPGSDDIRDSPALAVAAALAEEGAAVTAYDPVATGKAAAACPGLRCAGSLSEAARGADVLLLLTDWPEFAEADPHELGRQVARRAVADGRHALDPARWQAAGWRYRALGRPAGRPSPERDAVAAEREPVVKKSCYGDSF